MARWEQYGDYPKEGVKWLKPAHNPTGLLINIIFDHYKTHGICILKKK